MILVDRTQVSRCVLNFFRVLRRVGIVLRIAFELNRVGVRRRYG